MRTGSQSVLTVVVCAASIGVAIGQDAPHAAAVPPTGHSSIVESVVVSSDGKFFVTQEFSLAADMSTHEGAAILWDAIAWKALRAFRPAGRIALSGDDKSLAITSLADDGSLDIVLWDTAKLQKLRTFQVRPAAEKYKHDFSVGSLALNGDGTTILAGMGERRAVLWETATGKTLRTFQVGRDASEGTVVAISGDGRLVLLGLQFAPSVLWDAQTGEQLRTLQEAFYAKTVALSADGKLALTAGYTRAPGPIAQGTSLWDTSDGRKLHSFAGGATSAALSADGKIVAIGNGGGTVSLWRTSDGGKSSTVQVFQGRDRNPTVTSVGLSGDGRLLVAGDGWGTVAAWDTTTGEELHTFPSLAK